MAKPDYWIGKVPVGCEGEHCSFHNKEMDLSVLTLIIHCLREACDEGATNENIEECLGDLSTQERSFLEFEPFDAEKQMEKGCECVDANREGRERAGNGTGQVDVCEYRSLLNCEEKPDKVGHICLNSEHVMRQFDVCKAGISDDEKRKRMKKARQVLEFRRIEGYCRVEIGAMLKNEGIVKMENRCDNEGTRQAELRYACDTGCVYNVEGVPHGEDGNGWYVYNFDYGCEFADDVEVEGPDGIETKELAYNTVYFKGKQNVWHAAVHLCREFRTEGSSEVPKPLTYRPYSDTVNDRQQIIDSLEKCCDADAATYDAMDTSDPRSTNGYKEAECMPRILPDYTFVSGLLRRTMGKYSGKNWEICTDYDQYCLKNGAPPAKCDYNLEEADQMDFGQDRVDAKDIFSFLNLDDDKDYEAKSYALMACARGARMARGGSILTNYGLGMEGQDYALEQVKPGSKAISWLAYMQCANHMSVHLNSRRRMKDTCNADALSTKIKDRKC